MTTESVTFLRDKSYPFHVEDTTEGWPGAGFSSRMTEVKARRVLSGNVQVEIQITEIKAGRVYKHHGDLDLTPDLLVDLLKVLDDA